jgi:hypothetical protein
LEPEEFVVPPDINEFAEYLTLIKAAKAVGCTRRTLYRIIERIGTDEIVTPAFGRQLIHKSKLPRLREAYMPIGSTKRAKAAKEWGQTGGKQKRVARTKATKKA